MIFRAGVDLNSILKKLKDLLDAGCTVAVCGKDGRIVTDTDKGIRPLIKLIDGGEDLRGCSAADRIVGKAAALMYVLLGAREVYADVLAEKALEILRCNGIDAYYGELAPVIINRRGDSPCPMEIAVADTDDPEEAYSAVKACLLRLSEKNILKKRTPLDPTA